LDIKVESIELERVMIFIDGSNLYHGLKDNQYNTAIKLDQISKILCGRRKYIRTYYYNASVRKEDNEIRYQNQQKFFDKLRKTSYITLKLGRLERRPEGMVEKGVDVNIVVDMLCLAFNNAFDTAILISGDGDFATAIESVKAYGKHTENAYFNKGSSYHLRQACDIFIPLEEIISKTLL
jgi:uncharacterized LabA/DUF88 family protein